MLLKYNWQKINYVYLKCTIWYFLLYACTHGTITTVCPTMRISITPESFLVPFCTPTIYPLVLLFSWTSKTSIRTYLESRSGTPSLGSTIPTLCLFSLDSCLLAQDKEGFSLADGAWVRRSLALIHHVFSHICDICCESLAYRNTEAIKGLHFFFLSVPKSFLWGNDMYLVSACMADWRVGEKRR